MVSIVIPTRNRSESLLKVLESYCDQSGLTEMIIVDDGSEDSTEEVVHRWAADHSGIETKYVKHAERKGAASARHAGALSAKSEYILFGEDDVYLGENYSHTLLDIMKTSHDIGIVSGRIVYLEKRESLEHALTRFGNGTTNAKPFSYHTLTWNPDAAFQGDLEMPFTHAVYLTRKELIQQYVPDGHYRKGNGFREESDFQMQVFLKPSRVVVTNRAHCFHISRLDVSTGGQRMSRIKRFYWEMYHTSYFYRKYFPELRLRLKLPMSRGLALVMFFFDSVHRLFVQPLARLPRRMLSNRT